MTDIVPSAGVIALGKQGENQAVRVTLPNIRAGAGSILLLHQRAADQQPYPVPVVEADGGIIWTVSSTDTAFPGRGQAELQWLGADGAVIKSVTYQTNVIRALTAPGAVPDEPLKPYTQAVARDAQAAKNAAASATEAARSAEASAGQAGLSAATAVEAAKNAEAIVGQAGQSAQSAQAAALAAAQNAAAAEAAEAGAKQARTGAEAARTEAQTAQAGAVEAKTGAETAQAKTEEAAQGVAADREQIGANTAGLEAAQQDVTALKAETARTARSPDYLWKKSKGVVYDTETVTGTGSIVTVPSGAMDYAALRVVGGMSQRDEENNVLIDAPVDEVRVSNAAGDSTNAYPIPQAIRDMCPDYGIGVSADCYNYIDFAAKQYHHIVGGYVFGGSERYLYHEKIGTCSRNVIQIDIKRKPGIGKTLFSPYNFYYDFSADVKHYYVGKTDDYQSGMAELYVFDTFATLGECRTALIGAKLYFELATPETIDLSAVWPDDFGVLRVEAGGTINLHYPARDDGFELAVPSETEIMVDVAKVVETDG